MTRGRAKEEEQVLWKRSWRQSVLEKSSGRRGWDEGECLAPANLKATPGRRRGWRNTRHGAAEMVCDGPQALLLSGCSPSSRQLQLLLKFKHDSTTNPLCFLSLALYLFCLWYPTLLLYRHHVCSPPLCCSLLYLYVFYLCHIIIKFLICGIFQNKEKNTYIFLVMSQSVAEVHVKQKEFTHIAGYTCTHSELLAVYVVFQVN